MAQIRLAPFAVIVLAAPLAACFTPRVHPQISEAVVEARAHKDVVAPDCTASPLSAVSPAYARFAFNESELPAPAQLALDDAAAWLACHPQTDVAVAGAADNHGTAADQQALARRRQEAVAAYLAQKGVPAARVRLLTAGQTAPADAFVVQAEGRRW